MNTFDDILKRYRETREGFPDRATFLLFLATGDERRTDVQAARRLLTKSRYNS